MTDQTRLKTETAEVNATKSMASECNRQIMISEAWNRIFVTREYFSSDERIIIGFAGFIVKYLGVEQSLDTWLSTQEAYGLVENLIRDPIKIDKDNDAKRITNAKIELFLEGAEKRGFIQILRGDKVKFIPGYNHDKRFNWYRLAKGVPEKFEQFLKVRKEIDAVVEAQIANELDLVAGIELLSNDSIYHNIFNPECVDSNACKVPFPKGKDGNLVVKEKVETDDNETEVKGKGKVMSRPPIQFALRLTAAVAILASAHSADADMSRALGDPMPKLIQMNRSVAFEDTAETMNALLNAGADIEALGIYGRVPFHRAGQDTVKIVNARNTEGITPQGLQYLEELPGYPMLTGSSGQWTQYAGIVEACNRFKEMEESELLLSEEVNFQGIAVRAGYDIDDGCRYGFETNNDSRFVLKDMEEVTPEELRYRYSGNAPTVMVGCAPCQPFSAYKKGKRDDRWSLLNNFAELAIAVEPEFVSMENVSGLLNYKGGRVFRDFVTTLEKKYTCRFAVVDCSEHGIPQRRHRLVLVANKGNTPVFLEPREEAARTVKEAIGHLPELAAGEICRNDPLHRSTRLSDLYVQRIKASKPGGTWRDWPNHLVTACHKTEKGKGYRAVYGKMEWDRPAPTITTQCYGYGNGRFGHPTQNRGLSLREAAILQSFPQNYTFFENGCFPGFKAVGRWNGNAVPVSLAEQIATAIAVKIKGFPNA